MSYTSIKDPVKVQVWMRAGGRCEYRNCNKPLWRDDLTLWRMNRAYLAHIVADSPEGPRGDPVLSEQLQSDFTNIMLLCDEHHRLIDREGLTDHPVALLRQFKREHEERIERLTDIDVSRKTEVLTFGARINDRIALPTFDQVRVALAPERYPMSDRGIAIDLSDQEMNESDPGFWDWACNQIDRRLGRYIADGKGPSGVDLNHLSVFALAPIPLLIYLGNRLGDTIASDVYQRNRERQDWNWAESDDDSFAYLDSSPALGEIPASEVAVRLCLSGTIPLAELQAVLGDDLPIYTVSIAHPRRDFLRAKEHLELFRALWSRLLANIREVHGGETVIHLFPAIPNSVAVTLGQARLPKVDPVIVVYDHNRHHGGWNHVLTVK